MSGSDAEQRSLREYQQTAKDLLVSRGRMILADEPGLGKTPPAVLAARELVPSGGILVVAPKVAYGVWRREVKNWIDEDVVIYAGQPGKRAGIDVSGDKWVVTNYHTLAELTARRSRWPLVVFDESHHMANRKARFYKDARKVQSEALFELTGSPQVNGLWDLWTQLNLIDPKKFSSFWRFLYEHVEVTRGKFGMELGGPKNPTHTRAAIKPYLLRRTKHSSGLNLPPKQRGVLEAEHTPLQRRIYKELADEMVADLGGDRGVIMTPSRMALHTRLRQVNVTPALLGAEHRSGAFEALVGKLDELFAAGQHVIVFTPFTQAIPFVIDEATRLTQNIAVLVGGMTGDQIEEVVNWFQEKPLKNKLLIASIRAGTSWTATAASNCIFLGYDYTPMWNGQCEDRLHRFGQTTMVNAHYIVSRGTVDEHIMEILDRKTSWNNLILNPERLVRPTS